MIKSNKYYGETDISKGTGLTRPTVRKALEYLSKKGMVVRQRQNHGKYGLDCFDHQIMALASFKHPNLIETHYIYDEHEMRIIYRKRIEKGSYLQYNQPRSFDSRYLFNPSKA